jgi:hypothetical protein
LLTRVLAVWSSQADIVPYGVYAPVFCGRSFLFWDEIQVNREGDGYTEMLGLSDIYNDHDDREVVREANSDHSLGEYSARCSKVGKATVFFTFPSKLYFLLALIRISSG